MSIENTSHKLMSMIKSERDQEAQILQILNVQTSCIMLRLMDYEYTVPSSTIGKYRKIEIYIIKQK